MQLSPLPLQRPAAAHLSPRRKLSSKHPIYISPLKANTVMSVVSCTNTPLPPTVTTMRYSFNRSPSKDLHAINAFICEERSRKRVLSYENGLTASAIGQTPTQRDTSNHADNMAPPPPKFPLTVETVVARKISFQ